ncbi:hypothetical protein E2C01_008534 [Portunus trituberculatus]|uniref:Uncharacterized protein n=1 Tax=Portunus trituberculatus TaxID=210409 RepID=A0A5B7D5H7_PORTR|nr:hypothetical protein [Portunus trituberculatus]
MSQPRSSCSSGDLHCSLIFLLKLWPGKKEVKKVIYQEPLPPPSPSRVQLPSLSLPSDPPCHDDISLAIYGGITDWRGREGGWREGAWRASGCVRCRQVSHRSSGTPPTGHRHHPPTRHPWPPTLAHPPFPPPFAVFMEEGTDR